MKKSQKHLHIRRKRTYSIFQNNKMKRKLNGLVVKAAVILSESNIS